MTADRPDNGKPGFVGYPAGYIPPPTVDPSKLTTDAVNAATEQWRRDLQGAQDAVQARLEGMDRATQLRLDTLHEMPGEISRQVETLRELHDERFASLALQLALVEQQRIEQKADTKVAVDAALSAQKEAVREQTIASGLSIAKSEAATTKQLDQQSTTFGTAISGVTTTMGDLKERLSMTDSRLQLALSREEAAAMMDNVNSRVSGALERMNGLELRLTSRLDTTSGVAQGTTETRAGHRQDSSFYIAVAVAVMSALGLAATVVALVLSRHP